MPHAFRRIWEPSAYQGGRVTRRYFEGWYYKQVDAGEGRIVAIIPGVSYAADGISRHAFVQVVPSGGEAHYFSFPAEEFCPDPSEPFGISIAGSTFSRAGISLDLADDTCAVSGDLRFGSWSPWPVTPLSPGIMGWYRFVPGMETYHGVLSMDHSVSGSIVLNGERFDFGGGRGYAEKDWGRSFPSSWIWAQSNHFGAPGTSLTLSVARVPWMTGAFVGNIAGLLLGGELHRFATYTGARLECIQTDSNEAHLVLGDRREQIEIHAHGCDTLVLKAPVLGSMEGRDAESLGGALDVTLRAVRGQRAHTVFQGTGVHAGIEIMNDLDELGRIPCDGAEAT